MSEKFTERYLLASTRISHIPKKKRLQVALLPFHREIRYRARIFLSMFLLDMQRYGTSMIELISALEAAAEGP